MTDTSEQYLNMQAKPNQTKPNQTKSKQIKAIQAIQISTATH